MLHTTFMIVSILVFFLVLSILVLIHELGHFIAARRAGIWVEEFGFGLPPRAFGKKIGETMYSINWLPFGGFVKLHGENSEEGVSEPGRAFVNKSKKSRIVVIVAGVIMNFLLAILAFAIVYSVTGITKQTGKVKVLDVSAESPAQIAGILVGDQITKVDTKEVKNTEGFIEYIEGKKGEKIVFELLRTEPTEEKTLKLTITPRADPPENEGPLGVTISSTEVYYPPIWARPFVGVYYGFQDALFWGQEVFMGLVRVVTDAFSGRAPKDLGSPIAIYAVTSEVYKQGWIPLINLVGILSVNLAILNIMPFPALDGGRLLFVGIEAALGKKVLPKIENAIHSVGMVLLLILIAVLIFGDIIKLIRAGSITEFLNSSIK